jgi:predicted nucleic acid-binding protein
MKRRLYVALIGTMIMGVKAFVDTNILLRATLTNMEWHSEADKLLKQMLRNGVELWISSQVIREFIVQATHPKTLKIPLTIEDVIREISIIEQLFQVADETLAVRAKLLSLLQEFPTQGKQVHDANIVATMLVNEIDTLLTLNIDDFKRFSTKIKLIALAKETE